MRCRLLYRDLLGSWREGSSEAVSAALVLGLFGRLPSWQWKRGVFASSSGTCVSVVPGVLRRLGVSRVIILFGPRVGAAG